MTMTMPFEPCIGLIDLFLRGSTARRPRLPYWPTRKRGSVASRVLSKDSFTLAALSSILSSEASIIRGDNYGAPTTDL